MDKPLKKTEIISSFFVTGKTRIKMEVCASRPGQDPFCFQTDATQERSTIGHKHEYVRFDYYYNFSCMS